MRIKDAARAEKLRWGLQVARAELVDDAKHQTVITLNVVKFSLIKPKLSSFFDRCVCVFYFVHCL